MINLHGLNFNAGQQETVSRMSDLADRVGFIVVYPEGLGSSQKWNFGGRPEGQTDVEFIRELTRRLQSQLSLDPHRIYATGISNQVIWFFCSPPTTLRLTALSPRVRI